MFEAIAKILGAALSIWEHKEKNKYVEQLMELETEWRKEANKDPEHRSDAVLDNLEFKLRVLGAAFASGVTVQNSQNKPK